MSAERQRKVEEILCYLNAKRIRATYGAVGCVIGVPPQSVGRYLGEIRQEASWVVRKKDGQPTGYSARQKHPLLRCCQHVIVDCEDLRTRLQRSKGVAD